MSAVRPRLTRIAPHGKWRFLDFPELWHYRELIYFLALRDITVRYKQTAVGVAWVVLQPAAMIVVFTLFFGRLAKIPSEGVPYPLFVFAALLPWQVFSRAVTESAGSLVADQRLVSRVYFPRIIVPTSSVIAALFDFLVTLALFVVVMLCYGVRPGIEILMLPVFFLLMCCTALGVGLWLSVLNVEYRDVAYVLPFLNQIGLFVTPVVYPSTLVPEQWRFLYGLNPMAGVVDGFRWALLGVGSGPSPMLFASTAVSVTLFITGIFWFRRRERTMTDAVGSGGR